VKKNKGRADHTNITHIPNKNIRVLNRNVVIKENVAIEENV